MLKALEVLKEAKRRDISTIPVMVIISDGDANVPLRKDLQTGEIREFDPLDVAFFKHEKEAVRDVISVAEMMKKEAVYTVVINTLSISTTGAPRTSGSITTEMIASITNGIHHEVSIGMFEHSKKSTSEISNAIVNAQRQFSHMHYLLHKTRTK